MAAAPSTVQLWERLHLAGLATPDDCRQWAIAIAQSSTPEILHDSARLAAELIRLGKITSFQANVLFRDMPIPLTLGAFRLTQSLEMELGKNWFQAVDTTSAKSASYWVYLLTTDTLRSEAIRTWPPSVALAKKHVEARHPSLDAWVACGVEKSGVYSVCAALSGQSLSTRLIDGVMSWSDATSMIEQIAAGLQRLHNAGIVHGNISADAIWCADETEYLLRRDPLFPASNPYSQTGTSCLPQTTAIRLSIAAPELSLPSTELSLQTDLYALGCLWYRAMHPAPMYASQSDGSLNAWAKSHAYSPLPTLPSDMPASLQRCLYHLIAKNPNSRFANAGDLNKAIEKSLASPSTVSIPFATAASPTATAAPIPSGLIEPKVDNTGKVVHEKTQSPKTEPTAAPKPIDNQLLKSSPKTDSASVDPPTNSPSAIRVPPSQPVQTETAKHSPVAPAAVTPAPVAEKPVAEKPVAEKPIAEKPIAEKSVAEKSVAEKSVAEKPVAEKPVAEKSVAEKSVAEKSVAEKSVAEKSVAEKSVAEKSVAEKSVAEKSVAEKSVAEKSVAEKPVAEKPVAEKPVAEKPVAEKPVAEKPVAEKPVAEKPVAEKPVAEKPVAEKPVAEKPVAEKPVAEKPVAEKPVAEKPVAEKPANVTTPASSEVKKKTKKKTGGKKKGKKKRPVWLLPTMIIGACVVFGLLIAVLLNLSPSQTTNTAQQTASNTNAPLPSDYRQSSSPNNSNTTQTATDKPATAPRPVDSVGEYFSLVADDGKLLWAPPQAGSPYSLEMLPPGVEGLVFISKNTWRQQSPLGQVSQWWLPFHPELQKLMQSNPLLNDERIESVAIGLYPSKKSGSHEVVFRLGFEKPIQIDSVIKTMTGFSAQLFDPKAANKRGLWSNDAATAPVAFAVDGLQTDESVSVKRVTIGPQELIASLAETEGKAAPIRRQFETLLQSSDSRADLTVLVAPSFLFGAGKELLSSIPNAQELIKETIDESVQAVSLATTLEPRWYIEFRMVSSETRDLVKFATKLKKNLDTLPDQLETSMNVAPAHPYWRALANRYPQMLRSLSKFGRFGTEDGQVVANAYLPKEATNNLLISSWMALQNITVASTQPTDKPKPTQKPATKSIDEVLATKINIAFAQESLEAGLQAIATEVGDSVLGGQSISMAINGSAFQKEGITRNQQVRDFSHSDVRIRDVLMDLVRRVNPVTTVKSPTEKDQKVVWVILDDPDSPIKKKIELTTRRWTEENKATLPEEFIAKE